MKKKTFLVFILFLIWLNYLLSCQLPSRTNGLHLRPLIPDRYCYLKWRYITGWLTAPFTDKTCSSVTVSGTKLPMLYSKKIFYG